MISCRTEAYQAARAVFEKRELVDLTIAISLMNAYNRRRSVLKYPASCDPDGGVSWNIEATKTGA
jgi:alkylhydroperoxidase family enzyme